MFTVHSFYVIFNMHEHEHAMRRYDEILLLKTHRLVSVAFRCKQKGGFAAKDTNIVASA